MEDAEGRDPERERRVAKQIARIERATARPAQAPAPRRKADRAPEGRDPVTQREAALQMVPVEDWSLPANYGSTTHLAADLTSLLPAADAIDEAAVDALIASLTAVAPLTRGAAPAAFRRGVIDLVRFARGLGGDVLGDDPTRKQARESVTELRSRLLALAARFDPKGPDRLAHEVVALLRRHGGARIREHLLGEIAAAERVLAGDVLTGVGFVGRGRKGAGSVQREVARRLADLYAAHVRKPSIRQDDVEQKWKGAFLDWSGLILEHVGLKVGPSVLREAARRRRDPT